jgi:hypothetical protein
LFQVLAAPQAIGYLRLLQDGLLLSHAVKTVCRFVSEGERTDCTLFPSFRTVTARPHPKDLRGGDPHGLNATFGRNWEFGSLLPGSFLLHLEFRTPGTTAVIAGRHSRAFVSLVSQGLREVQVVAYHLSYQLSIYVRA